MTVATWWAQLSPGPTYVRADVPARHLPGQVLTLEHSDLKEVAEDIYTFPRQKGTAIWQYPGNATRGILMAHMQELGVRVLIEVDDDYTRKMPWMGDMDATSQFDRYRETIDPRNDFPSIQAHRKIVPWVDGVIVSTPHLAEVYSDLNDNIYVCPNSVDIDDWDYPRREPDGILRIGWASSDTHYVDQKLVRRAMEWAVKQKDVEVYLIGYQPPWRGQFKRIPWSNSVEKYRQTLVGLGLDIGICPIKRSNWAEGKSDLKALEYAMAGAASIVSRVKPYEPWFDKTISCDSPKDWEDAMRWAVLHRDEVEELKVKAVEYTLAERTIKTTIKAWEEACVSP